jgi:hypothetical protein
LEVENECLHNVSEDDIRHSGDHLPDVVAMVHGEGVRSGDHLLMLLREEAHSHCSRVAVLSSLREAFVEFV